MLFIKSVFWKENSPEYNLWLNSMQYVEKCYFQMIERNVSPEQASSVLPNSLKNMNCIFYDCKALKTAPDIPSTVTSLTEAFYNCSTLVTAPTIPANVNDMQHTFANCINLTGTITINANPKYTSGCFYGTVKPIRITGACNESIKENLKGVYTNISY